MLFIEWWLIERCAILLAVLALASGAMWLVRNRRRSLKITVVTLCSPFAVLAASFLFFQLTMIGCLSFSPPVYSPDHLKAARVRTDDEGATGGNSQVELISKYGFSSVDVYSGEWKSVDIMDIHWISDTALEVTHDEPMWSCQDAPGVRVRCIVRAASTGSRRPR